MYVAENARAAAVGDVALFASSPDAIIVFPRDPQWHGVVSALSSTIVGLTTGQRRMLMDKLPDAANLALGGMVFGQFLGDRPFRRR